MVETQNLESGQTVKESIKLSKMSKGYQWEIRILAKESNLLTDDDLKRLKQLNDKIDIEYGGTND